MMTKEEFVSLKNKMILKKMCVCYICGGKINSVKEAKLNHVLPLTRGGEDVQENWQVVHKKCDQMKGNLTYPEFIRWRLLEVRRRK